MQAINDISTILRTKTKMGMQITNSIAEFASRMNSDKKQLDKPS